MSDSAELHRICRDLGGRPHDWGARAITARRATEMSRSSAAEAFNWGSRRRGKVEIEGRTLGQKKKTNKKRKEKMSKYRGPACQSVELTL